MWPSSCRPIEARIAEHEEHDTRGGSSSGGHRELLRSGGRPRRGPRRRRPGRRRRSVSASEGTSCAPEHAGDRVDDLDEPQPPVDGTPRPRPRWPRCRPPARCRPRSPGLAGQPHGGERLVVEREELPGVGLRPVDRRARCRAPGRARPGRGRSGSASSAGWPAPAWSRRRTRPSSAPRDVGWTTTSIRSKGMPKSRCASITSSPLLTRVAELMVTTGPMSQVGWASACVDGHVEQLARGCGRGTGRRDAVSTSRRTSSARAAAQALRQRASARSRPARSGRAWPARAPAGRP